MDRLHFYITFIVLGTCSYWLSKFRWTLLNRSKPVKVGRVNHPVKARGSVSAAVGGRSQSRWWGGPWPSMWLGEEEEAQRQGDLWLVVCQLSVSTDDTQQRGNLPEQKRETRDALAVNTSVCLPEARQHGTLSGARFHLITGKSLSKNLSSSSMELS